ncbi:Glutathione gamma-glutamylcysteinyltransferase 1, partial [Stylosanthes scabra]|nr:Glutathione gamma-glutamylcysteinyltransferase 1 [Stylosanthes scabra]
MRTRTKLLKLFFLLILQTSVITIFQIKNIHCEAKTLTLPLKSRLIPSGVLPRPPNKLFFHHNVSLTVSVAIGTPSQNVTMVIDTGSELSWLHCTTRNTTTNWSIPDPLFNPTLSSSFTLIPCSSSTCTIRTQDFPIPASCDSNNHCHATLSYFDASSSEGDLASKTFQFGSGYNPGIVFGCMNSSFSSNVEGDSNTTGLLGMNL